MSSISFIVVIVSSLANMPYLNNQINMYVYKSLIGLSRSDSLRSQFDQSNCRRRCTLYSIARNTLQHTFFRCKNVIWKQCS